LPVGIQETVFRALGIISVYCTSPATIENARHNALPEQTTFDLNTTLQYQCYRGYVTDGFSTAKCLELGSSASWFGPDFTCKREYVQFTFVSKPDTCYSYNTEAFHPHSKVTEYEVVHSLYI
jgi:hypothetical protein